MKHLFYIFTLFILSKNVFAQDTIDTLAQKNILEELRVVACYTAPLKTIVPHFNHYDLGSLFLKYTGQEPSFLFSGLPSVTAYSDAGSGQGYSYLRIRGIDQTRINISIDGVPLNEPEDQGAYFSNFPDVISCMRSIDLYRGASTTKNGIAGYGGSIIMNSNTGSVKTAAIGAGYGSFNTYRAYGEYASGTKNKKSFYVRGAHVHSNGYKYNSGNTGQSLFMSGIIKDFKLNVLVGHQQNQLAWLGVRDSLIEVDPRSNGNKDENDNFTQGVAQLHYIKIIKDQLFKACLYYIGVKGNYDFNLDNFLGYPVTTSMYNYAFQSALPGTYLRYEVYKSKITWLSGVFANTYSRQHTGSEKTIGHLYTNTGFKNEFSAFTKMDLRIKKFVIGTDIQYRYTNFNYSGSVKMKTQTWQFLNPRLVIKYKVFDNLLFNYSLAQMGREPTRNDMFGGNDDLLADSSGNAVLFITVPEYVIDHELGFTYSKKRFYLDMNAYYMDFKKEIVLDGKFGPNGLALTNNVDKSFRTGIELSIKWEIDRQFYIQNNSSFNCSKVTQQNTSFIPILTPPVIINQDFGYKHKKIIFSTGIRYQGAAFIDYANTAKVNAYFLVHANVHYNTDKLTLGLVANNLTNSSYFNQGYVDWDGSKKYFIQAPMNFTIRFEYRFLKNG